MKLKEYLKNKIPENKLKYIPSSFDIIGQVCVIELKNELRKYFTPLKTQDTTTMARKILRLRFLAQEILAKALELLKSDSKISL